MCVCVCVFVCVCVCVCVWEGMCCGFNLWPLILMPPPPGHRLDDVPAVRRHLVRRSSRGPVVHVPKDQISGRTPSQLQHLQHLRPDRTPHEVRGRGLTCLLLHYYESQRTWSDTSTNSPTEVFWTSSVVQWWRLKTEDFQREFWTDTQRWKWQTTRAFIEVFEFLFHLAVVEVVI